MVLGSDIRRVGGCLRGVMEEGLAETGQWQKESEYGAGVAGSSPAVLVGRRYRNVRGSRSSAALTYDASMVPSGGARRRVVNPRFGDYGTKWTTGPRRVYQDLCLACEFGRNFLCLPRVFIGEGKIVKCSQIETSHLASGAAVIVATMCLVLGVATFADGHDGTSARAVRHIRGRTIVSGEFPKADLNIGRGFRFVGTQQVTIHGNAEAEQYIFAKPGRDNIVVRFYLIQFEHFLPTNDLTYNYASMPRTQIGNLPFNYDVKSLPDLGALLMEDKGSDGAAMEQLLAKRHLSLPPNTAIVRMFHLPSADHRTELMIIYGEALPQDTDVSIRKGGVTLDKESPGSAQMFLEHARQGLAIQAR